MLGPLGRHDGERSVECDLLIVSGGEAPAASLALQAGARTRYDPRQGHFALVDLPQAAHAAGSLFGQGADAGALGRAGRRSPPRTPSGAQRREPRARAGGAPSRSRCRPR